MNYKVNSLNLMSQRGRPGLGCASRGCTVPCPRAAWLAPAAALLGPSAPALTLHVASLPPIRSLQCRCTGPAVTRSPASTAMRWKQGQPGGDAAHEGRFRSDEWLEATRRQCASRDVKPGRCTPASIRARRGDRAMNLIEPIVLAGAVLGPPWGRRWAFPRARCGASAVAGRRRPGSPGGPLPLHLPGAARDPLCYGARHTLGLLRELRGPHARR